MAGKPNINSRRATAERLEPFMGYKPTAKQIRMWEANGYPFDNPTELKRRVEEQQTLPKGMPVPPLTFTDMKKKASEMKPEDVEAELAELRSQLIASADLKTAQTIKVKISGLREVLKELREQGKYILREVATAAGMEAGLASLGAWERIEDDLPPMLEGLTAAQMKVKLRDYGRLQSLDLAKHFAT